MPLIHVIPILKDNYAHVIEAADNHNCAVIDPGEAEPVADFINARGLHLTYILNTHKHWDHTDGNLALKDLFECNIVGPHAERDHIPGIDIALREGDSFSLFGHEAKTLHTPGHTLGHCTFYLPDLKAVFVGDVLFSMSCGRLFEGTHEEAWDGFEKIMALPDDTMMYAGHEYTLANAKWAMHIEPNNLDLQKRYEVVKELRRKKLPTLPVSLGMEKATNPFLRAGSAASFKKLRLMKDVS